MLLPRIIPCLLIKNKGLVKTVNFDKPKYIGDPINAVKIFNEKEVDELIVLDIDASVDKRQPDYNMIQNLAEECRMPLCYGGGVKSVEQIEKIIGLGVEKVAISSAAVDNPNIIKQASQCVGNQSLVVILDIKKRLFGKNYNIWINNGSKNTRKDPVSFVNELEKLGAGEIVINSIDNDGTMNGYDFVLIQKLMSLLSVPTTVLGGAGSLEDIGNLINKFGLLGAAAGSLFVFKGAYRAVLINYPNKAEKEAIFNGNYYQP